MQDRQKHDTKILQKQLGGGGGGGGYKHDWVKGFLIYQVGL